MKHLIFSCILLFSILLLAFERNVKFQSSIYLKKNREMQKKLAFFASQDVNCTAESV